MNIRQMQSFLKVAETGSFTAAAEELFLSQSSLSKQVIALESELGVLLIDRSRRKIALTAAGEIFRKHAQTLNADYLVMLADRANTKRPHRFPSSPSPSSPSMAFHLTLPSSRAHTLISTSRWRSVKRH